MYLLFCLKIFITLFNAAVRPGPTFLGNTMCLEMKSVANTLEEQMPTKVDPGLDKHLIFCILANEGIRLEIDVKNRKIVKISLRRC